MAILANGLETIDLGSTGWRDVINSNLNNLFTQDEIKNPVDDQTFTDKTKGVVLIDRTTNTPYRLYIDNGVLDIENV